MEGAFQTVFVAGSRPVTQTTFVRTTQNDKGESRARHTARINTHLANHRRVKRERSLINAQDSTAGSAKSVQRPSPARWLPRSSSDCSSGECSTPDEPELRLISESRHPTPTSFDEPLLDALDPFLRLPLELSPRDRSMLAYFLTEGRKRLPGTTLNPQHCVCVRIARDWIQYSPLHVSEILMSTDFMISKVSGQSLPLSYHRRRMKTLALVRSVIANPANTYSYKLYAIMILIWMAYTMDWPDLRTHLNAVNVLLQSTGKGQRFTVKESEGPTLRPQWLVGMFLVTEYRITSYHELASAGVRLASDLRSVSDWHRRHVQLMSLSQEPVVGYRYGSLRALYNFLLEPLDARRFSVHLPFAVAAAPFFCCYSIAITFGSRRTGTSEVWDYLHCVQQKLPMIENGCSFGGTTLSHMLADARSEIFGTLKNSEGMTSEVTISQSVMNALKLYSLMSANTRISVTRTLFDIVFSVWQRSSAIHSAASNEFGQYQEEIEMEWLRSRN